MGERVDSANSNICVACAQLLDDDSPIIAAHREESQLISLTAPDDRMNSATEAPRPFVPLQD
jgi:hypothetical protein